MIQWALFYKILGISDQIAQPDYYQLLAITPDHCSPEAVDLALQKRKKQIRQNISNPRFIPFVMQFESQQLEKAAATLRDPSARAQYDKQRTEQTAGQTRKQRKRAQLLRLGRKLVLQALNPDGTLPQPNRQPLADQLKRIGFSKGDLLTLFNGIPLPPEKTDQPGQPETRFFRHAVVLATATGFLDAQREKKLIDLADNLGIPQPQAREMIHKYIQASGTQQVRSELDRIQTRFSRQLRAHTGKPLTQPQQIALLEEAMEWGLNFSQARQLLAEFIGPEITEDLLAQEEIHQQPPEPHPAIPPKKKTKRKPPLLLLRMGFYYAIPILICLSFLILLWQLNAIMSRPDQAATPEDGIMEEFQSQTDTNTADKDRSTSPQSRPIMLPQTQQELLERSIPQLEKNIRHLYAPPSKRFSVMVDIALTTAACADRMEKWLLRRPGTITDMDEFLMSASRFEMQRKIAAKVRIDPALWDRLDPESHQRLQQLARDLMDENSTLPQRYRAIELLDRESSSQARAILMKALTTETCKQPDLINRIVHALTRGPDSDVIQFLIDQLQTASRPLHRPITETLVKLYNLQNRTPEQCPGRLPLIYTQQQLQQAGQWWKEYFYNAYLAGSSFQAPDRFDASARNLRPEQLAVLELQAYIAKTTSHMADLLEQYDATARIDLPQDIPEYMETPITLDEPPGQGLSRACRRLAQKSLLLARSHPRAEPFAAQLDHIEWTCAANLLLAEHLWQDTLIHMETFAAAMTVMIQQQDTSARSASMIDAFWKDRCQQLKQTPDLLAQLRTSSYYNLILLDWLSKELRPIIPQNTAEQSAPDRQEPFLISLPIRVRINPFDKQKADQKKRENQLKRQHSEKALAAFARLVEATLKANPLLEKESYQDILADNQIRQLSRLLLDESLETFLAETKKLDNTELCPLCGQTAKQTCPTCQGLGLQRCPLCKGKGILRRLDQKGQFQTQFCPTCQGLGSVPCQTCQGLGTIPCPICQPKITQAKALLTPGKLQKLAALLSAVRYLQAGGIDLYSKDALTPLIITNSDKDPQPPI